LLIAGASVAQPYPAKPVRVLTPFPTGSGPDSVLRLVGEKLAKVWGRHFARDFCESRERPLIAVEFALP
jgi:tripartite-type tricarboxylate transporter receptor subunit TctC